MSDYIILHEDPRLVVVDKLGTLPVLPDKTGDTCLRDMLAAALGAAYLEAPHRLDRRVSGALVFARSAQSNAALSAAFRERRAVKAYLAVVERKPAAESGTLVHRLVHDGRRNVSRAEEVPPATAAEWEAAAREGKALPPEAAVLAWRRRADSERYSLLEVELLTGRPHQIRAQVARGLSPLRGDLKYGSKRSCRNGLVMLHAFRLGLPAIGRSAAFDIEAPLPADEPLWAAFGLPLADSGPAAEAGARKPAE